MNIKTLIGIYGIAKEYFTLPIITIILALIGTTIIIRNRKEIIGFAIRTGEFLQYIAIHKKYQGKKHGTKLLIKILPDIRRLRVAINNERAINLYERYGFKKKKISYVITGKQFLMER